MWRYIIKCIGRKEVCICDVIAKTRLTIVVCLSLKKKVHALFTPPIFSSINLVYKTKHQNPALHKNSPMILLTLCVKFMMPEYDVRLKRKLSPWAISKLREMTPKGSNVYSKNQTKTIDAEGIACSIA